MVLLDYPFIFDGVSYNALYIGANGMITFNVPNTTYTQYSTSPPTGIYPFYTDLNTFESEFIKYQMNTNNIVVIYNTSIKGSEVLTDIAFRTTLHLINSSNPGLITIEYGLCNGFTFQAGFSFASGVALTTNDLFNQNSISTSFIRTYTTNPSNKTITLTPRQQSPLFQEFRIDILDQSKTLTLNSPADPNSSGAVSYVSSSPSIAEVVNNILTVKSSGTVTITAQQSASGNYRSGTTSYTLRTNYLFPPTTTDMYTTEVSMNQLTNEQLSNVPYTDTFTGDEGFQTIELSQPFIFHNVSYTTVYLTYNGDICFAVPTEEITRNYKTLPVAGIYPFHRDLNTHTTEYIRYKMNDDNIVVIHKSSVKGTEDTTDVGIRTTLYLNNHTDAGKVVIDYGEINVKSFQAGYSVGNPTSLGVTDLFNKNRLPYNSGIYRNYYTNPSNKTVIIAPVRTELTFNIPYTSSNNPIPLTETNLTQPISNRPGKFRYTSLQPTIAEVIPDNSYDGDKTLTVKAPGSVTIQATQEVYGYYNESMTSITLDTSQFSFEFVCFRKGTKVMTDQGYVCVEDLCIGDRIETPDRFIPIRLIGSREIINIHSEDRMTNKLYVLSPEDYPELTEELIVTGAHSILVDQLTEEQQKSIPSKIEYPFMIGNKYRLPVCLDYRAKPYEKEIYTSVYHFSLECDDELQNHAVYANGILSESCCLKHMIERSGMSLKNFNV